MLPGRDGAISPGTRRLSPLPVGEIACTQTLLGPELADNAEQTVSPYGPSEIASPKPTLGRFVKTPQ